MHHRTTVLIVGLTLTAACGKPAPEPVQMNPPPQPPGNPPEPIAINPPTPLPTWDDVESGHPVGATNPPFPVLIVTSDGARCYKQWVSPMVPPGANTVDRVADIPPDAGFTEVQCPPNAKDLLAGANGPK